MAVMTTWSGRWSALGVAARSASTRIGGCQGDAVAVRDAVSSATTSHHTTSTHSAAREAGGTGGGGGGSTTPASAATASRGAPRRESTATAWGSGCVDEKRCSTHCDVASKRSGGCSVSVRPTRLRVTVMNRTNRAWTAGSQQKLVATYAAKEGARAAAAPGCDRTGSDGSDATGHAGSGAATMARRLRLRSCGDASGASAKPVMASRASSCPYRSQRLGLLRRGFGCFGCGAGVGGRGERSGRAAVRCRARQ